jgi:hypothetical protein
MTVSYDVILIRCKTVIAWNFDSFDILSFRSIAITHLPQKK